MAMKLRTLASVASGALLLVGIGMEQAGAQTYTLTDIVYSQAGPAFTGTNGSDAVAATAGTASSVGGVISDPLTNFSFTGPLPGGPTISLTGGSGTLSIIGSIASMTLNLSGATVTGLPVGTTLTDLDLQFTPSSTPGFVGGGTTTTVGPVTITSGTLTPFGDSASVTHVVLSSAVPEPGMVSLLAGLAVVGSGFGLRRRRKA
jgi:hypothetical protein